MIYVKKVAKNDERFKGRNIYVFGDSVDVVPVPDNLLICDACNKEIGDGYLVYLSSNCLTEDRPYEVCCENCLKKYFKKYKEV